MSQLPFHTEPVVTAHDIYFVYFRHIDGKYSTIISAGDESTHDGGSWPTIGEADARARLVIAGLEVLKPRVDVLAPHVAKRAVLAVTYCHEDARWAIVAGYRKGWEDTNMRFDSQEEARKVRDAAWAKK